MPDDDLISLTLVTLYEQGYAHPAELEDALCCSAATAPRKTNAWRFSGPESDNWVS